MSLARTTTRRVSKDDRVFHLQRIALFVATQVVGQVNETSLMITLPHFNAFLSENIKNGDERRVLCWPAPVLPRSLSPRNPARVLPRSLSPCCPARVLPRSLPWTISIRPIRCNECDNVDDMIILAVIMLSRSYRTCCMSHPKHVSLSVLICECNHPNNIIGLIASRRRCYSEEDTTCLLSKCCVLSLLSIFFQVPSW